MLSLLLHLLTTGNNLKPNVTITVKICFGLHRFMFYNKNTMRYACRALAKLGCFTNNPRYNQLIHIWANHYINC